MVYVCESPPIESHPLRISVFFREKKKRNHVFASVRAGDVVNGYDSLLLSTTALRGEGGAPEIPVTRSVRANWRTRTNIYFEVYVLGYITLPTGPRSHVGYIVLTTRWPT